MALDFYFGGPLTAVEQQLAATIDYRAFPTFAPLMQALTDLGGNAFVSVAAASVALYLYWKRRPRDALLLVIAVYGVLLLNPVLKQLFQRARPLMEDPVLALQTYSFPSGHAVAATALYGGLAMLASRRSRSSRVLAFTLAALLIAIVCMTRVYLGVHHLSDVLAGVLVGIAWLLLWRRVIPEKDD